MNVDLERLELEWTIQNLPDVRTYYKIFPVSRNGERVYSIELRFNKLSTPIYEHECPELFKAVAMYYTAFSGIDFQAYMDGIFK